jgi:hypothetical protein
LPELIESNNAVACAVKQPSQQLELAGAITFTTDRASVLTIGRKQFNLPSTAIGHGDLAISQAQRVHNAREAYECA